MSQPDSSLTVLTREDVRRVDQTAIEQLGLPGIALMENAGNNATRLLIERGVSGNVSIVAGGGNNGGDGFVIARHLALAGKSVEVLLCVPPEKLAGDAATNFRVAERLGIAIRTVSLPDELEEIERTLSEAEWIVDALFGTGLDSHVRAPFDQLIECINRSRKKVLAVDIPSGLDCDAGVPLGVAVRADLTVTFVALKPGFLVPGANAWTGHVLVAGIGVPSDLVQRFPP